MSVTQCPTWYPAQKTVSRNCQMNKDEMEYIINPKDL